ncbi:hypothetical protein DERP_010581 [Dermatophagoides pteronyssinus]|uniref:Uncharacterized protein n=1 Tax=Dermatophagoides pteronyssinus TaxID=6956 RepID=A0ABQ8JFP8_DERPT|nr:hypothetical protein DERP_010581 [Dermatophagoides pteronyssinus]
MVYTSVVDNNNNNNWKILVLVLNLQSFGLKCLIVGDDELVWLQCGPNNPVDEAGIECDNVGGGGCGGCTIAVHGADIVKLGVPLIGLSGGI